MGDWISFNPQGGVLPRFLQVLPPIQELIDNCTQKLYGKTLEKL